MAILKETQTNTNTNTAEANAEAKRQGKPFPGVSISGHLAGDPELRYTANGTAVSEFRVLVNNTQGGDPTAFRCAFFGRMAEHVILKKGDRVELSGDLKVDAFIKDGAPHASAKLSVSFGKKVTFVDRQPVKENIYSAPAKQ